MNNTPDISDAEVKKENTELSTKPTDKDVMDALIKQAKFAEDYYDKLVLEFVENLKKTYT